MLIDQAFDLILKLTGAQEALLQSEGVIWLQQKLGLDPDHPPDNFDSVYTYTLVNYTLDESGNRRPKAPLTFFRHAKIRDFIRLAYEERSVSKELQQSVTELLIGPTGQELNALGIDIVTEMRRFEALFNEVVKRTRTPKDVRQEKDIAKKFNRIEQQMRQQQRALQASIEQTVKQLAAGQSAALPGAKSTDFPLVGQVKAWFKALDYGEDNYTKAAADHCEWMITIPARRGFDRILVRCVDGEASQTDVEQLYDSVENQDANEKIELVCFSGHTGGITSVEFSPDGRMLATGSVNSIAKLWLVNDKQELTSLIGHEDEIKAVAFSPDGEILATGSHDKTVRLWSVRKKEELVCLTGHTGWIRSVTFSPDGLILATGSYDNTVKLWSINEKNELISLLGHTNWVRAITFSPDGKTLATGSADKTVRLWSVSEKKELASLIGHTYWVNSLAFSPDGSMLAPGSYDGTVKLWSGSEKRELISLTGFDNRISSITFSPDGKILAIGTSNQGIHLWDANTSLRIAILDDRLCFGLNITDAVGITDAQRTALKLLGAVDHDISNTMEGNQHAR